MKSVEIEPRILENPSLSRSVLQATEILENEIRISSLCEEVSASWTLLANDGPGLPRFRLRISDDSNSSAYVEFTYDELKDHERLQGRMIRLWGDLLQLRSHQRLDSIRDRDSIDRNIDGSEALDRLIDSVADYSEREGHEPKTLKLPIRYATALMKLGPSYWGDFYSKIRETGLRAFDGQTLLGMKVELVPGVNGEIQID